MSLELLKKRLLARGGNAEGRMNRQKLETLEKALLYSYQAETIVKDGVEYRALLNSNKLKMDYDDKIISIPFESNMKVGDIFYWGRSKSDWIVYLKQVSEDAYFRGYVRRADHKIKWLNEFGKEYETSAAIRGPVETKITGETKKGIFFDTPNYTLSIIIPSNEETQSLKRYSKISLDGSIWEITVSDSISEPGVIDLQVIETLKNKDLDSDVVGGLDKPEIKAITNLDELSEIEVGLELLLDCDVYVNNKLSKELANEATFKVLSGPAKIEGLTLITTGVGEATISLDINKADLHLIFKVLVQEAPQEVVTKWGLKGNTSVKSYGSSTYSIEKIQNGKPVEAIGHWNIKGDSRLFSIEYEDSCSIILRWKSGLVGRVYIEYIEDDASVLDSWIQLESIL